MTTEEILAQLRSPGNRIPREALAEVIRRREEFVPLLVTAIEEATELADDLDPDDNLPAFAACLLAELREPRGLEPILAWFALDETTDYDIFGDLITSDGHAILAGVAHDNPDRLRDYLRHEEELSPWVRAAAMDALVHPALRGEQPRESVVQFFSELLATNAFGSDVESWTLFVGACLDLHPGELLEGIRGLYEREVIDLRIVGDFDAVEKAAARDLEENIRESAERYPPLTDTARAVGWWDCFAPQDLARSQDNPFAHHALLEDDFVDEEPGITIRHEQPKIGRNDQCPCGSGKKYKKCCMPAGG